MYIKNIWLNNFRNYSFINIEFCKNKTAFIGNNGQGKTNLIEAIGWFAKGSSFRGSPTEALIKKGEKSAILRAEVLNESKLILLEVEISPYKKNRIQIIIALNF